jgi:hypothetical protein
LIEEKRTKAEGNEMYKEEGEENNMEERERERERMRHVLFCQ